MYGKFNEAADGAEGFVGTFDAVLDVAHELNESDPTVAAFIGATRAERNARIYAGIAREPQAAVVKLADRIANVEAASAGSEHGARYAREADAFADAVGSHVPPAMWSRLEAALAGHRSEGG